MIFVSEIKVPIAKPIIGDEEIENVVEVLKSGMIAQGPKVAEFEQKFAEPIRDKYQMAARTQHFWSRFNWAPGNLMMDTVCFSIFI